MTFSISIRAFLLAAVMLLATACDLLTGPTEPFTGLWKGSNDDMQLTLYIRQYRDSLDVISSFVVRRYLSDGPRHVAGRAYGDSIALRWPMPPTSGYSSGRFYGHRAFMTIEGVFQGKPITLTKR